MVMFLRASETNTETDDLSSLCTWSFQSYGCGCKTRKETLCNSFWNPSFCLSGWEVKGS